MTEWNKYQMWVFCIKSAKDNSQCVNKQNFSLQPTDHRLVFFRNGVKVTISKTFLHLNEKCASVCVLYKYVFHAGCQMFPLCLLQIYYCKEMLNTYTVAGPWTADGRIYIVYHFCVKVHVHLCHCICLSITDNIISVMLLKRCAIWCYTITHTPFAHKEHIMQMFLKKSPQWQVPS